MKLLIQSNRTKHTVPSRSVSAVKTLTNKKSIEPATPPAKEDTLRIEKRVNPIDGILDLEGREEEDDIGVMEWLCDGNLCGGNAHDHLNDRYDLEEKRQQRLDDVVRAGEDEEEEDTPMDELLIQTVESAGEIISKASEVLTAESMESTGEALVEKTTDVGDAINDAINNAIDSFDRPRNKYSPRREARTASYDAVRKSDMSNNNHHMHHHRGRARRVGVVGNLMKTGFAGIVLAREAHMNKRESHRSTENIVVL